MTTARTAYIGRNDNGHRVFVHMNLEDINKSLTTTHHHTVNSGVRISVTGSIVGKGSQSVIGVGQVLGELRYFDTGDSEWTPTDVQSLIKVWKTWHLNDMRAGCAHMILPRDESYDARKGITCVESGYKYGSAWLYEAPTHDVLREYKRLMALPTGDIPSYIF